MYGLMAELVCLVCLVCMHVWMWMFSLDQTSSSQFIPIDIIIIINIIFVVVVVVVVVAISNLQKSIIYQKPHRHDTSVDFIFACSFSLSLYLPCIVLAFSLIFYSFCSPDRIRSDHPSVSDYHRLSSLVVFVLPFCECVGFRLSFCSVLCSLVQSSCFWPCRITGVFSSFILFYYNFDSIYPLTLFSFFYPFFYHFFNLVVFFKSSFYSPSSLALSCSILLLPLVTCSSIYPFFLPSNLHIYHCSWSAVYLLTLSKLTDT